MAQVLLCTSPNFRGTISRTPSGKVYHVEPGQIVAVEDVDADFLEDFGFTPAPPSATSSGDVTGPASSTNGNLAVFDGTTGKTLKDGGAKPSAITMSDGSAHTITNLGSLVLGAGGTASGSGGVGTISGFGGGGGSYSAGLGIDATALAGGTIANTGTIAQPAVSNGTSGQGINLTAAKVTSVTAGSVFGPPAVITSGDAYGASGHYMQGGEFRGGAGNAYIDSVSTNASGGIFSVRGGRIFAGGTARGGDIYLTAGSLLGVAGRSGSVGVFAGQGGTVGGNIVLKPATVGFLITYNIPTADPHVLDAMWRTTTTNGLILSQG